MNKFKRIGIDTSKNVFQLHGVNDAEEAVLRRKVRRQDLLRVLGGYEPTIVGMEACGASHHWAREIDALGHQAVLIPPQFVKAYVPRNKNDQRDAEGVCEAMSRPHVKERFVPKVTIEQQALKTLIELRSAQMRRRTQVSNTIRGHAAEYGHVVRTGLSHLEELYAAVIQDRSLPAMVRSLFDVLMGQYVHANAQIDELDKRLAVEHRNNEMSRRLAEIPAIGQLTAIALTARVSDVQRFGSGRNFAAFLGLTPKDHSTAGRHRSGGAITRAGDEMLRSLLVTGAMALIRQVKAGRTKPSPWLEDLLKHKSTKHVAVALANKNARIAWRLMVSGERYRSDHQPQTGQAVDMWATPGIAQLEQVALPT